MALGGVETTSTRLQSTIGTAISSLSDTIIDMFHLVLDQQAERGVQMTSIEYEDVLDNVLREVIGDDSSSKIMLDIITGAMNASDLSRAVDNIDGNMANIEQALYQSPTDNILSVMKDIKSSLRIVNGRSVLDDITTLLAYQSAIMLRSNSIRGNITNPVQRVNAILSLIEKLKHQTVEVKDESAVIDTVTNESTPPVVEEEESIGDSTIEILLQILNTISGGVEGTLFTDDVREAILSGKVSVVPATEGEAPVTESITESSPSISAENDESQEIINALESVTKINNWLSEHMKEISADNSKALILMIKGLENLSKLPSVIHDNADSYKTMDKDLKLFELAIKKLTKFVSNKDFTKLFQELNKKLGGADIKQATLNMQNLAKIATGVRDFNNALADLEKNRNAAKVGLAILNDEIDEIKEIMDKLADIKESKKMAIAIAVLHELTAFLESVAKIAEQIANIMSEITKLVLVSTVALVIGGLFMLVPNLAEAALLFADILFSFVFKIAMAAAVVNVIANMFGGSNSADLEGITKLVAVSAASMAIGGLFMLIPGMPLAVDRFGTLLLLFVAKIVAVYAGVSHWWSAGLEISDGLNKLILSATAALLIGGLFMYLPNIEKNVFKFGILLAMFVGTIIGVYSAASKWLAGGLEGLQDVAILVLASTGALLLGGLFMYIPGMADNVIEFGLLLAGFVSGLIVVYGGVSRFSLSGGLQGIDDLVWLVGMSALIMVAGPAIIRLFDIPYEEVDMFMGRLFSFVAKLIGVVGLITTVMGLLAGGLGIAAGAMGLGGAGVIGVTGSMAAVVAAVGGVIGLLAVFVLVSAIAMVAGPVLLRHYYDGDTAKAYADIDLFFSLMGGVFLMFGALAAAAGAASKFVYPGLAVLAAIELLIFGVVKIVSETAEAMKLIEETFSDGAFDTAVDNFGKTLFKLIGVFKTAYSVLDGNSDFNGNSKGNGFLSSIGNAIFGGVGGMLAISQVALAASDMGVAVLTIAKAAESMQGVLDNTNFDAEKMSTSITSLIRSMLDPIQNLMDDPKMMPWFKDTLFGDEFPAMRVVNVVARISDIITNIATGIQDMANLNIPQYGKGGEIIARKQLEFKDFENAATNIDTILTHMMFVLFGGTVGEKTYSGVANMEWFEGDIFGNGSNAKRMVDVLSSVGNIISSIATGILDYANLSIPTYGENGQIIGKTKMDDTAFENAGNAICNVMTTMMEALFGEDGVMKTHKKWFDGDFWGSGSDAQRMMDVLTGVGSFIGNTAKGIQDMADLKIPIKWDKGEPTAWLHFGEEGTIGKVKKFILDMFITVVDAAVFGIKYFKDKEINKSSLKNLNELVTITNETYSVVSKMIKRQMDDVKQFSSEDLNIDAFAEKYQKYIDTVIEQSQKLLQIGKNENFTNHKNTLDEYVKVVNKINVNKLDSLTKFSDSIGKLTADMLGLKTFSSISQKLAETLDKLTAELRQSYKYIDKNEKMHENRKKAIENSIANIKNIMSQPLMINIENGNLGMGDNQNTDDGNGGVGGQSGGRTGGTPNSTRTGGNGGR